MATPDIKLEANVVGLAAQGYVFRFCPSPLSRRTPRLSPTQLSTLIRARSETVKRRQQEIVGVENKADTARKSLIHSASNYQSLFTCQPKLP